LQDIADSAGFNYEDVIYTHRAFHRSGKTIAY
jgi:hypothetical protein